MNPAPADGRPWRKLKHLAGRAIHDYDLIHEGDRLAVGVSGGKDSLLLIHFLTELRRRAPVNFGLGAFHLGPEYGDRGFSRWLDRLKLDFFHHEPAPEVPGLIDYRPGDPSPCFNCARLRRSRLFELSREYQVNRLALGHHLDDAIETLLMNMIYSGRLEGLLPRQELFEGRLSLIRPLFLIPEAMVVRLSAELGLPVRSSGCPADGHTRRQDIKEMVAGLTAGNFKVYGNLSSAVREAARAAERAGTPRGDHR